MLFPQVYTGQNAPPHIRFEPFTSLPASRSQPFLALIEPQESVASMQWPSDVREERAAST
jgi:hypothetical protein